MTTSSTQTTRSTEFHQQTLQPTPAKEEMSNHITSKGCKPRAKKNIYINLYTSHPLPGVEAKAGDDDHPTKTTKTRAQILAPIPFCFLFFASLSINKKKVKKETKNQKTQTRRFNGTAFAMGGRESEQAQGPIAKSP